MHYYWVKKKWFLDGVLGYIAFSLILYINTKDIEVDVDPHYVQAIPFDSNIETRTYNAFSDVDADLTSLLDGNPSSIYTRTYNVPDIGAINTATIDFETNKILRPAIDYDVDAFLTNAIVFKIRRLGYSSDSNDIINASLDSVSKFNIDLLFSSQRDFEDLESSLNNVSSVNPNEIFYSPLYAFDSEANSASVSEFALGYDYLSDRDLELEASLATLEDFGVVAEYTSDLDLGLEANSTSVSEFYVFADYSSDDYFEAEFDFVNVIEYGIYLDVANKINIEIEADLETAYYLNFNVEVIVPKIDFYINIRTDSISPTAFEIAIYVPIIDFDAEYEMATAMSFVVPLPIYKTSINVENDISTSISEAISLDVNESYYKIDFNNPDPDIANVIEENGIYVSVNKIFALNLNTTWLLNINRTAIDLYVTNNVTISQPKPKLLMTLECDGFTLSYRPQYYLEADISTNISTSDFDLSLFSNNDYSINISFATPVNVLQLVTNNISFSNNVNISIDFFGNRRMVFSDWGDSKIFKDLYGRKFSDLANVDFAELDIIMFGDLERLKFSDLATKD